MTPHKSDACRKEIKTLLEYDMIEPSKSPWACGVVMAKKKGDYLRFCCEFRYLNSVTVKDAYPIPRIDESLSKLGDAKFFTTLDVGSAFWQVPLRKQDRDKTGTRQGSPASWVCFNGNGCRLVSAMPPPPPHFSG